MVKKAEQDLGQEVYTNLMREMAQDSTSQTISYENLSLLLFMTQKAISDLKLLKSLFFHRKSSGNNNNFRSHRSSAWNMPHMND